MTASKTNIGLFLTKKLAYQSNFILIERFLAAILYAYEDESYFEVNITFKPSRKECKKKHENRCREILENIYYPHTFPSVRPDFLKNPSTGKNLEIDCYNHILRIGLEYQGKQHTSYMPYFHSSIQDFEYQVHKDKYKKMQCQRMGIKMIYVPHTVKYDDLFIYIQWKKLRYRNLL